MSEKKRRPLHFALSGALLVPGLVSGCGPEEEPAVNVPAPEPPVEVEETANPVGEEPPPTPRPRVNVPAPPPEPTPNPSGDDPTGAHSDSADEGRPNPVGDRIAPPPSE